MKTSHKHLRTINQNILIIIAVIITMIGLSLKAEANTHTAKSNNNLLSNNIKLQLNNTDLSVLIPKLKLEELTGLENAIDGQLVYVTNDEIGFYKFIDNQWSKTNVIVVLKNVQESLEIYAPALKNIILTEANNKHSNWLDYNGHIRELHKQLGLHESRQNYAAIKRND